MLRSMTLLPRPPTTGCWWWFQLEMITRMLVGSVQVSQAGFAHARIGVSAPWLSDCIGWPSCLFGHLAGWRVSSWVPAACCVVFRPAAAAPSAITVGATTNTDSKSYFSNFGSCVDIWAPGLDIKSAVTDGPTAYAVDSGTSMASEFLLWADIHSSPLHSLHLLAVALLSLLSVSDADPGTLLPVLLLPP